MPSFGLTGVDVLNAIGPLCSAFVVLLPIELFGILFHTVCNVLQRSVIGMDVLNAVCPLRSAFVVLLPQEFFWNAISCFFHCFFHSVRNVLRAK